MGSSRPALRSALTLADQALSSAQNFALVVLVARQVTTAAFGAFSLGLALLLFLVGLSQALISEPLLLRHSLGRTPARGRAMSAAFTVSCAFSILWVGVLLATAVALTAGSAATALLACAACVLPLVLADLSRMVAVAVGRPVLLLMIDGSWIATWLVLLAVLHPGTPETHLLAWGLSSTTAAMLGYVALRPRPSGVRTAAGVWREGSLRDARPLLGDFFATNATAQLTTLVVATVANLAAAGALRAVQTLFGPLNILVNASRTAIVPEIIRCGGSRTERGARYLRTASGGAFLVTGGVGLVLLLLPAHWGGALLGATWPGARMLLVPLTLSRLAGALTLYPMVALRADRSLSAAAWARTMSALVMIVATAVAAATLPVRGVAWTQAAAGVVTLVLFLRAMHRHPGDAAGEIEVDAAGAG